MEKEEISKLSEELKVQRFRKGKSQEECANILGISIPTYRELEYNPNKINLEQAFLLSDFLDWNLFEFFLTNILQNAIKEDNSIQEKEET